MNPTSTLELVADDVDDVDSHLIRCTCGECQPEMEQAA